MIKTGKQAAFVVIVLMFLGALSCVVAQITLSSHEKRVALAPDASIKETPPIRDSSGGSVGDYTVSQANPQYEQELQSVVLTPQLDLLLERSKKDPAFAYALAVTLQDCSNLGLEEQAYLEKAESVEHGREFGMEQDALLEKKQKRCEGVDRSAELRHDLIDRAASSGIVEAQIAFRAIGAEFVASEAAMKRKGAMEQYKQNTLKYAYEAARSGSPEALFNAYEVVSSGLFAPRNEALAYSYLYAYSKVKPSPRTSHLLAIEGRRLSANDLARAQSAAESMVIMSIRQGATK